MVLLIPWNVFQWVMSLGYTQGAPYYTAMAVTMLLSAILPYLIGSINPAILISRLVYRKDIRQFGSGNAGTTNMLRTFGKGAAAATFLLDLAKAAVAIVLGQLLCGMNGCAIAGFFVIFGHMFPIFEKFKGGKGVACLSMIILLTSPLTFLVLLLLFLIMVIGTRMVSFASIFCAILYPLILRPFLPAEARASLLIAFAILTTIFVVFMHRSNMKRIMEGKESKLDFAKLFGKKKKNTDDTSGENGDQA